MAKCVGAGRTMEEVSPQAPKREDHPICIRLYGSPRPQIRSIPCPEKGRCCCTGRGDAERMSVP